MPTEMITLEFVSGLDAHVPAKGLTTYFDSEQTGFVLEHRASGGGTYYFRYRDAEGVVRLCRIGRVGEMPLAEARARALQMRQLLGVGGDPKRERYRFNETPTLDLFLKERYVPYVSSRKRSWRQDIGMLDKHVCPVFGRTRLNRISAGDVRRFHQNLHEMGYSPATCNRMLVMLGHVFNCAIRFEVLPPHTNPCKGVELFELQLRERYLRPDEVQALFAELDVNPNTMVGQVIRLLLYTGARKREVMDARWSEVDLDNAVLWVPPERSKSKRPRPIALSHAAVDLIRALPREPDVPYLFFNPRTRKPPVSIFTAWDSIRRKLGLEDLRLHDLRHSYASFLVNAGRSLYEVQRLLGHQDPKVTMRYAHLSQGAMVEAANVVADVLAQQRVRDVT
jgi:integrase